MTIALLQIRQYVGTERHKCCRQHGPSYLGQQEKQAANSLSRCKNQLYSFEEHALLQARSVCSCVLPLASYFVYWELSTRSKCNGCRQWFLSFQSTNWTFDVLQIPNYYKTLSFLWQICSGIISKKIPTIAWPMWWYCVVS